jgi:hypothetical protein
MFKMRSGCRSRKEIQIAGNHEALGSSVMWRGCPTVPLKVFRSFSPLRFKEDKHGRLEKSIPPMLAAQSALPSGTFAMFGAILYYTNESGDDP